MSLRARCGLVLFAVVLLGVGAGLTLAQEAEPGIPALVDLGQVRFEIVDATFLTHLEGDNASYDESKPEQFHGLVVTVKVTKPGGRELVLHPADLPLHYRRGGGGYDVAPCNGISAFSTSRDVDRTMKFFSNGFGSVSTGVTSQKSAVLYADLFFQNMEPDTRDLYLMVAQPAGARYGVEGWTAGAGSAAVGSAAGLEGVWEDTSTQTLMTVVRTGDSYSVTSAVDGDGEEFPVSNVGWADGALKWTYSVPSTGYRVNWTTTELRGDELETRWDGTAGSGTEVLHRVGPVEAVGGSAGLDGVWLDGSTGTRMTVERDGDWFTVTSAVDDDGERYPVSNVDWTNGVLRWTCNVPSTGYKISWTTVALRGDELECSWTGTAGSGSQVLTRVGRSEGGDTGGSLAGVGVRVIHVARRLEDAREVARRLRALAAMVELFETSDSGNEPHLGMLYAREGFATQAATIVATVGDLEELSRADRPPDAFGAGQQFNLWVVR